MMQRAATTFIQGLSSTPDSRSGRYSERGRRNGSDATGQVSEKGRSARQWALRGFYISALNPKVVFLLFLALLPQFATPDASWPIPIQMIALDVVHVLNCGMVYFAVGLGASRVFADRPGLAKNVSRVSGAIMIVLALLLVMRQILAI